MTISSQTENRIRELLEAICRIQQTRSDAWSKIRTQELSKLPRTRSAIFEANGVAYSATRDKMQTICHLQDTLFNDVLQIDLERIHAGAPDAIDRLLVFLGLDIPAFRCGYAKELLLRHLKRARLNHNQQMACQAVCLFHCKTLNFRREFKAFARLAIRVADCNFISQLRLLSLERNAIIRHKALFMLIRVLNARIDLRSHQDA